MIISKEVEMIFESIPGLILQLFAYLTLPQSSNFALFSIVSSATTVSFGVSVMYFDKDVDPRSRKIDPSFYGVFPDNVADRTAALLLLWLFTFVHVMSKAVGVSLFWTTFGGVNSAYYLATEIGYFFVVKAIFKDFHCWVPMNSYQASCCVSTCQRLGAKIMTDYTGFLQMRHPYELG